MKKIQMSIHPDDDLHYNEMGLTRNRVELWEDGARVDGSKGTYEWWYYDSHYPDGTILVIFMYSKISSFINISTFSLFANFFFKMVEDISKKGALMMFFCNFLIVSSEKTFFKALMSISSLALG